MPARRIALLLPGQGSQHVGMGRDLASARREAAEVFERANDVLGVDLRRICWEGPEAELTRTENAQPAILVHSYAAWSCLPEELRRAVSVGAGHSLGEFSAYLMAGALGFDDALRLVRRRGELMARAGTVRPGTMAALIGLEDADVRQVCADVSGGTVVPANYNAPGQVVISGDVRAVEAACERALEMGAKRAIPLNVSGAFHSPLMVDARDGLAAALGEIEVRDPEFPVVANSVASPVTGADRARELLIEQLTSPVRWVECVESMVGTRPDGWLELGPGKVLMGLMRRIDRSANVRAVGDPGDLDGIQGFLEEGHDA
ncbi:MAG: ACP S-malonyltransferase [Candidatus Palauibacterales bacterium]|nr:ACP S-malonyltransferase [Candidatus Palauibacterales bacterium]